MAAFGTKTLHSVGRKLKIEMQSVCGDLNTNVSPHPTLKRLLSRGILDTILGKLISSN